MLAGIREVMVITTPEDQAGFQRLLGDGSRLGMKIVWQVQERPDGLAQAFILGEDFVDGRPSALVLGDNLFYGGGFTGMLQRADARAEGATVFGYPVADARRYGVVELGSDGRAIGLEEKPAEPRSNLAVTGLYFVDATASAKARDLKPSPRGELEITDLNRLYLEEGSLHVEQLGRGFAWLDTGTHDSLLEAGEFVRTLEHRQGLRIGCVEEIAFTAGWIDAAGLKASADRMGGGYAEYLRGLAAG